MMWSKAPWGNIKLTIIQPVFKIYSHQLRGIEENPIKHLLLLFFLPGGKQSIYLPLPWLENCNFKTKQNKTHTHTHTHFSLSPKQKHSKKITKHFLWPSWELHLIISNLWVFLSSPSTKNLPAMQEPQETWVRSLGQEDPLGEGMATHSSVLAWRIPWTEESGRL